MNTPSPLIPQGATPPRAKSSLYFKILMVLSVHVVVIGGMLVQGCNNTKDQAKQDKQDGNMLASTDAGTTAPTTTVSTPVTTQTPATTPTADVTPIANPSLSNNTFATATASTGPAAPLTPPGTTSLVPPAKSTDLAPTPSGDAKEYVIAKGDTFGAIARRNGISVKSLMEANPNVNAKKLQIGQKVQIPAATAALAATSKDGAAAPAAGESVAADGSVYVVKPGDMLLKIAKAHGTTVKKIMAMNALKSTSIRAGQKLKVPSPKTTTTVEPAAATASTAAASLPAVTPVRNPAIGSPVAAN